MTPILSVRGLSVAYATPEGAAQALDAVDLEVRRGETLGIVGESGSGKSTLAAAIGRLLPPGATRLAGAVAVDGVDVFASSAFEIRALRRRALGFVVQNPITALNPTMTIGEQVRHAAATNGRGGRRETVDLLRRAGLPDPERVARSHPHELSGGMAQRVAIAMAISRRPSLLIADEPTASLDTSIRDQILDLLTRLGAESGASLILLSHDLGMIGRRADRVAVMYGGRIVELGDVRSVFAGPRHPYTAALMRSAPGMEAMGEAIHPIPGAPPLLRAPSERCAFAPRCALTIDRCRRERPEPRAFGDRLVACHRAELLSSAAFEQRAAARTNP